MDSVSYTHLDVYKRQLLCYPTCLPLETVREILAGGAEKVKEAGAVLAGGHTIEDDEPKYGLCVTGFCHPDKILTNSGAKPGDVLVLTKPLGTGILPTAATAELVSAEDFHIASASMAELNRNALEALDGLTCLLYTSTAKVMDDMEHICHRLCRMIDVALKVYQGRPLFQNSIFMSLLYSVHHIMHIFVALANIHIITDTDYIRHEGDHIRCFTYSLTVCDLGFSFVQILYFEAEEIARRSKAETRTGRVVAEEGDSQAAVKNLSGDIVLAQMAQSIRYSKNSIQLVAGLFPGCLLYTSRCV